MNDCPPFSIVIYSRSKLWLRGINIMDIRKSPWQSRYGWIWYNSKEILRDTQEDIELM
jgi:hypothetical protein